MAVRFVVNKGHVNKNKVGNAGFEVLTAVTMKGVLSFEL
jgi:hypothetical protein